MGGNLKINSKILGILSALFVLAIVVSSAGAAADLEAGGINSDNFALDVPSGSDFVSVATTNLNVGDVAMNMEVFENKGENANDVSTIMYLKDSSSNQNIISDLCNDLKNDGPVIEENENYFVVENKNSNDWDFWNFDIGNDIENIWNFATGIFSSDSNVDVATEDADVQVSNNDGININTDDNTTVSLSSRGLEVSDPSGEDVSISTDGVKVSDAGGDSNVETNVTVDEHMVSTIDNADYALCIKNPDNDQAIVLCGNNLELLKSMAESASFS